MARSLHKSKNRRESGLFIPFPLNVLQHPNYLNLSGNAIKLLHAILPQLRLSKGGTINNGDIAITPKVLPERYKKSNDSLHSGIKELIYYGFIVITRYGDRRRCHLYAVTWWAIDECSGKLDVAPTNIPLNTWKDEKPKWKRPQRKKKLDKKLNTVHRFPAINTRISGYNSS